MTLGHSVRILDALRATLRELDDAACALAGNIDEQERREAAGAPDSALFEEGGRLSVAVHHRVDAFCGLVHLLVETAPAQLRAGVEALADPLDPRRDLHVRLGRDLTASVWAASGDAGISPGPPPDAAVSLHELLSALEERVARVRAA